MHELHELALQKLNKARWVDEADQEKVIRGGEIDTKFRITWFTRVAAALSLLQDFPNLSEESRDLIKEAHEKIIQRSFGKVAKQADEIPGVRQGEQYVTRDDIDWVNKVIDTVLQEPPLLITLIQLKLSNALSSNDTEELVSALTFTNVKLAQLLDSDNFDSDKAKDLDRWLDQWTKDAKHTDDQLKEAATNLLRLLS